MNNMNVTLDDLGAEYRHLLGGTLSNGNLSQEGTKKADNNLKWTRVLTREHFAIPGVFECNLAEDVAETWEEI